MMHYTDATGLLGEAIAIAAIASRAPGVARLAPRARRALLGVALLASFIPIGGLPLAAYLRGVVGDLSIASLVLLALYLARFCGTGAVVEAVSSGRQALLALAAVTAVVFYPLALGWGGFDPYRLGYGSYALLGGLLGLTLWGALRDRVLVAVVISLAVAAWSAGWYESGNLWDYLLDPLVSAYALGALARRGLRELRGSSRLQ